MEDIKAPEVGEEEFMLDHGHVGCTRSLQAWKLGTNPPFGMKNDPLVCLKIVYPQNAMCFFIIFPFKWPPVF